MNIKRRIQVFLRIAIGASKKLGYLKFLWESEFCKLRKKKWNNLMVRFLQFYILVINGVLIKKKGWFLFDDNRFKQLGLYVYTYIRVFRDTFVYHDSVWPKRYLMCARIRFQPVIELLSSPERIDFCSDCIQYTVVRCLLTDNLGRSVCHCRWI